MRALCADLQCWSYLRDVDTSLLERAVIGVLGAHVAVLAPVAGEGAIYTGKAAKAEGDKMVRESGRLERWGQTKKKKPERQNEVRIYSICILTDSRSALPFSSLKVK